MHYRVDWRDNTKRHRPIKLDNPVFASLLFSYYHGRKSWRIPWVLFSFHLLLEHLSFSCCRGRDGNVPSRKTKQKISKRIFLFLLWLVKAARRMDGPGMKRQPNEGGLILENEKRKKKRKTIFSCPSVWSRTYKKSREPDTDTHTLTGDLAGPEWWTFSRDVMLFSFFVSTQSRSRKLYMKNNNPNNSLLRQRIRIQFSKSLYDQWRHKNWFTPARESNKKNKQNKTKKINFVV